VTLFIEIVQAIFLQAAYISVALAADPSYAMTVACTLLQLLRQIKNNRPRPHKLGG